MMTLRNCFAIALLATSMALLVNLAAEEVAAPKGESVPDALGKRWMTSMSDAASLATLSIPGTHNACALHGAVYGKCQDLTLKEQLNAGVRFLDIRCRQVDDKFQIYHGPIDQRISFGRVRAICADFLKQNPGECLLMSVKEEGRPMASTLKFGECFKRYLEADKRLWSNGEAVPSLGTVRGKIVVVSRNHEVAGIPWRRQFVQDAFKVSDRKVKWQKVQNHFVKSKPNSAVLNINFCSGTGIWNPPRSVAKTINGLLAQKLKKKPIQHLGVVVMDFPSKDLIRAVFTSNVSAIAD